MVKLSSDTFKATLNDENATQEDVNRALKALIEITETMNKEHTGSSKPPVAPELPKTGDSAPWLPLTMLLIFAGGTAIAVIRRRKRAK